MRSIFSSIDWEVLLTALAVVMAIVALGMSCAAYGPVVVQESRYISDECGPPPRSYMTGVPNFYYGVPGEMEYVSYRAEVCDYKLVQYACDGWEEVYKFCFNEKRLASSRP